MKCKIEQGNEIITSNSGSAIVGKIIENQKFHQNIVNNIEGTVLQKERGANVLSSWIGLCSQGRTNYEDITLFENDPFFQKSLGLTKLYSSSRF